MHVTQETNQQTNQCNNQTNNAFEVPTKCDSVFANVYRPLWMVLQHNRMWHSSLKSLHFNNGTLRMALQKLHCTFVAHISECTHVPGRRPVDVLVFLDLLLFVDNLYIYIFSSSSFWVEIIPWPKWVDKIFWLLSRHHQLHQVNQQSRDSHSISSDLFI